MDNALYNVLLGCPFLTLTQAVIQHFSNGKAHAMITNLNTGSMITFQPSLTFIVLWLQQVFWHCL